uniref:Uncharacterized protein n=1 Tax=Corvus moneduloides TaxID=1196302 RepID=A0A8U7ND31_CORMO
MEKELLEDYRFGRQQLIEIWGHACAVAVTKVRLGTPQWGGSWPAPGQGQGRATRAVSRSGRWGWALEPGSVSRKKSVNG